MGEGTNIIDVGREVRELGKRVNALSGDVCYLRDEAAEYMATQRYDDHRARRERIATAALDGLASNSKVYWSDARELARDAVAMADALIAELDKEQP